MATINIEQFKKDINKNINSLSNLAYGAALKQFNAEKADLLREFNTDKITQEIEGAENASNISGTLGGRGNLFSFIGFNQGDNPITEVREVLENNIKMDAKPLSRFSRGLSILFRFRVTIPDESKFEQVAPMPPWDKGRTWLKAIEDGITGLGQYIYWRISPNSRSGTGIQAKPDSTRLRDAKYTPPKDGYVLKMLKRFRKKLES